MKKLIQIFSCLILMINSETIGQIKFQKNYGGTYADWGNEVQVTNDGGYVIVGTTNYFSSGPTDICLIKTNSSGDTLWSKIFGGIGSDYGQSVQQTSDSGYVVAGFTDSYGAGNTDVCLLKTDVSGNLLWMKTYGWLDDDRGYYVTQTFDGGFIISGNEWNMGGFNGVNAYLIKTDSYGDTLWTRILNGMQSCITHQTSDSGYIVTGVHNNGNNYHIYLTKLNQAGNIVWVKQYAGINADVANDVLQTSDGGFIIAMHTGSFGAGGWDGGLIKTDSNGVIIWSKTYGGVGMDVFVSVKQNLDGGFIIAGNTISFGAGSWDIYLIRTDSIGDTLWTKTYGSAGAENCSSLQNTSDGGYIIVGISSGLGGALGDIYLIKTDINGNTGCNENSTATILNTDSFSVGTPTIMVGSGGLVSSPIVNIGSGMSMSTLCFSVSINENTQCHQPISIFPNPFQNELTISVNNHEPVEVILYDLTSRILLQQKFTNSTTLNTQHLANGMYMYEVRNKGVVIKTGKVVKD